MGMEVTRKNGPQSINIWLDSLRSTAEGGRTRTPIERVVEQQKDDAILTLLAQTALHYWRPDFTAAQARQLYSDYLADLRGFAFEDIAQAIDRYRRDGENKFFPTCGQLRGWIETVPSWDVNSRQNHIAERRQFAQREMQTMVDRFLALPAPDQAKQLALLPPEEGSK